MAQFSHRPKATVLIADDHPLIGEGIAALLRPEFEVLGVATDGWQLLEVAERLRPTVITLDISMPKLNGMEAARQLRKVCPDAKLVFVTQEVDLRYLKAALHVGAKAFVAKHAATGEILLAVRQVLQGGTYITPLLEEAFSALTLAQAEVEEVAAQLTPRQRQVLQLIAEGHSAKSIASVLGISAKTVDFHKDQLMTALGVRTTAELTKYAVAKGITGG